MSSNNSSTKLPPLEQKNALEELKDLYSEKRNDIHQRLREFREILDRNDDDVFAELCFCLLTPQSSAKTCWPAVSRPKERRLLWKGEANELQPQLTDARFADSKPQNIV